MSDRTEFEPDNPLVNLVATLLADMQALHGVTEVLPIEALEEHARRVAGDRRLRSLAVPHEATTARAAAPPC